MNGARRRVAVVGSGIAGLAAASTLASDAEVVLFEADSHFGGHAHTVDLTLGGVSHGNPSGVSGNVAAWALGGGLDWKFTPHSRLALRLVQADYLGTQYASATQNTFRLTTGLVFSFGGKK